jgi:hypothetical protein
MPNVVVPLPNIDATVTHAMVADLALQVKKLLELDYVKEMVFVDDSGTSVTPSSFHGVTNVDNNRYARFSGNSRLWIEAREETNVEGWSTMVVEREEFPPVFHDQALDVLVCPVPVSTDLVLKFVFRTPSRDEATRWLSSLTARLARVQEGMQHTLTHSMNLPPAIWNLLIEVYNCRETKAPYEDDFFEYIKANCSTDLTLVSEASGEMTNLSFIRRLSRVNGRFVVSPLPERPSFQKDEAVWECTMEYKVTYDKPISCRVRYPIVVHNSFLPAKYIQESMSNISSNFYDKTVDRSLGQQALSEFEGYQINGYRARQDAYLHIPTIDDFIPRVNIRGTATIALVMVQLDDPPNPVLFNLAELGEANIHSDVLDFLRAGEHQYLNQSFKSFFGVCLYRGQDLTHPSTLEVDANLDVRCTENLDLRQTYRVRFYMVVDPCLVPFDAQDRLNNHPRALALYVRAVNEALRNKVDFVQGRPLAPWQLSALWRLLNGMGSHPTMPFGSESSTAQTQDTALIPKEAWYSLRKSLVMRTVQISGLMVQRKG